MTALLLLALASSPDGGTSERGPFSRAAVQRVVRKHRADLRACGVPEGFMEMSFVVSPEGRVRDVTGEASNILHNGELFMCVVHKLRSWDFPSPGKKPVTVKHFRFVFPPK